MHESTCRVRKIDCLQSNSMMEKHRENYQKYLSGAIEVLPLEYRSAQSSRFIWQSLIFRGLMILGFIVFFLTLAAGVGYTFLAQPVVIRVEPVPDLLNLHGGFWRPF